MILREGAEPAISEKFYCAVIQAVLLFGDEMWVLLAPISQRIEGVCVGFLRQVTKLKGKNMRGGLWQKVAAKKVLQGAGTQPLHIYLEMRQTTVTELVSLRPIFGLFTRDMGYEGGGKIQVLW